MVMLDSVYLRSDIGRILQEKSRDDGKSMK